MGGDINSRQLCYRVIVAAITAITAIACVLKLLASSGNPAWLRDYERFYNRCERCHRCFLCGVCSVSGD